MDEKGKALRQDRHLSIIAAMDRVDGGVAILESFVQKVEVGPIPMISPPSSGSTGGPPKDAPSLAKVLEEISDTLDNLADRLTTCQVRLSEMLF